jgi:hypothetical protein
MREAGHDDLPPVRAPGDRWDAFENRKRNAEGTTRLTQRRNVLPNGKRQPKRHQ